MRLKMVLGGILVAGTCLLSTATAADYFNGSKPVDFIRNAPLEAGTTIADYPIFNGDGSWTIRDINANESKGLNSANSSRLGRVALEHIEPHGNWFASQVLTVSTQASGGNTYVTGSTCSGPHLFISNRGSGLDDNSLNIDARNFQSGSRWLTYFYLNIVQTLRSTPLLHAPGVECGVARFSRNGTS